jgi:hypothetical protein
MTFQGSRRTYRSTTREDSPQSDLRKMAQRFLSTQEHHPLDLLSGGDEWAGILAIEEWNQGW